MHAPKFEGKSTTGRRSQNQDSYLSKQISDDIYLSIIADGVGGNKGGEIASALVVKRIEDFINNFNFDPNIPLKLILEEAFKQAQNVLIEKINEEPELKGMGTTLVCLLIYKERYVFGNIGDSRLYLISNEKCLQVTEDHSYINQLISQGNTENMDQIVARFGHIITRVVDGGNDKPDIYPIEKEFFEISGSETFVACSDGLIVDKGQQNTDWLLDIYSNSNDVIDFSNLLTDFALDNGSTDNISVSIIDFNRKKKHIKQFSVADNRKIALNPSRFFNKMMRPILLFIIILLLIIIAFISGNLLYPSVDLKQKLNLNQKFETIKTNETVPNFSAQKKEP